MNKKVIFSLVIIIFILAAVGGVILFKQIPEKSGEESANYQKETPGVKPETQPTAKLIALGSSMSRASNLSSQMQGENNEYSFSTGTKIPSVYGFLKKKENNLTAVNLASPGAETQDISERQLPEALQLNPEYITIDPAADIVGKSSVSEYKKNLTQILDRINPKTTIMIFSYPNFLKMRTASFPSCRENKVGVNLENLSEKNILSFNQTMKEVVKNRNNVILIDAYDLLGPEHISDYDCLHVNAEAQQKIAAEFIRALNS